MSAMASEPGPYAHGAPLYWAQGWRGLLPLPYARKADPPSGWTGRGGGWPSWPDLTDWASGGARNLGLRLPPGIIGVDVDQYGAKEGGATLAALAARLGELPATWRTTSRTDGVSGIRLYRVPETVALAGVMGPGIEVIQWHHRYAVVWPSVHPEGGTYRWITPGGADSIGVGPAPGDLPELPQDWVAAFTRTAPEQSQGASSAVVSSWWQRVKPGAPCRETSRALGAALERLGSGEGRHDSMLAAIARLTHLGAEGHTGTALALGTYRQAFIDAVSPDREPGSPEAEWSRALAGPVAQVTAPGAEDPGDVPDACTDPWASLIPPGDLPGALAASLAASTPLAAAQPLAAGPPSPSSPGGPAAPLVSVLSTDEARAQLYQRALAEEVARLRLRAEARALLDEEEALAAFTAPRTYGNATQELALPPSPVVWAVDEVLPAGGNVALVAAFKAGKTTMVNHLARCLVDGVPFLGAYEVKAPGPVALFNYEVSPDQYVRWLREAEIQNTDQVHMVHLRGERLSLLSRKAQDWLVEWLGSRGIQTWVVDPFARAFMGMNPDASENSNTDVGRFLDILDQVKLRAGVGQLVMPAHTGRAIAEAGAEKARGATRLDDWADVRWILNKDAQGRRYFRASGRDVETSEAEVVHLPPRGLLLTGHGRAATVRAEATTEVMMALGNEAGLGVRKIRERVSLHSQGRVPRDEVDNALAQLMSEGRVRREEGAGRTPHRHFLSTPGDLIPGALEGHDLGLEDL